MKDLKIETLKNGDVLHCKRNTFLSKAIRFFTTSTRTSHTAIVVKLHGQPWIVDSQAIGTFLRPYDAWINKYKYEYIITRGPRITEEDLLKEIEPFVGSPYGYLDIIKQALRFRFGIKFKNKNDKNLTCSEFFLKMKKVKGAYKGTPEDAYLWCLENNYRIIRTNE